MSETLYSTAAAPSPVAAGTKRRVVGLPLLRGLAALSVALYHYTGAVLPKLHVPEVHELFKNGWLGVQVFFVISGFVIPYSLLGKNYSFRQFIPYITKRIVRINPPAYIALLLVLAQWYFIDYIIAHQVFYTSDISVSRLAHNIFFTVPFSEQSWIIGIFWTLAIEFQFYIIIGLLFSVLFERQSVIWLMAAFCFLSLGQYLPFRHIDNFFHFSALFGMGGLTVYRYQGKISTGLYWGLLGVFTALAYVQIGHYQAFTGLGTALAIEYVTIDNSITRFLGNISYSFYLVHALIGNTCEFFLVKFIPIGPVVNRIVLQLVCLGIAVAGAYVFYLVVERPFMRLANKLK